MFRRALQRSLGAARKAMAWNLEDLAPPREQQLFQFASDADVAQWQVYSDSEHGGLSSARLEPAAAPGSATALFSGDLSLDLKDGAATQLKRSGFAGFRTLEGGGRLNLEDFDTLAFRVRGDGRVYVSNIRTDSWIGGPAGVENNNWQAFVFAPREEWGTVYIPLRRYLLTWKGKIIDLHSEMNQARILGMGISLAADGGPEGSVRGPGPFRLQLGWMKALRREH